VNGILLQLGLVAVLVLLNAAFSGSEIALISLREGQLQRLEQRGSRGRLLVSLARDPNRFLAAIQVGITLAGFLASATAAVSLAEPLQEPLGFLGRAARPVSIVVVTIFLAYLTLVFGELAPKRVAMQRAEGWGMVAARPLSLIAALFRPVIWLLAHSTDLAVRLMRGDPHQQREEVTDEELRDLVAAQTSYTPEQRNIISGAFEIAERRLREVLSAPQRGLHPRSRPAVRRRPPDAGRLRPLPRPRGRGRPRPGGRRGAPARPPRRRGHRRGQGPDPVLFPESLGALEALHQMQERGCSWPSCSTSTGDRGDHHRRGPDRGARREIWDESDRDVAAVERAEDGFRHGAGLVPLPRPRTTSASCSGGRLLDRRRHRPRPPRRIPEAPGDSVEVDGWHLEVLAVDRRAITRLCIKRVAGVDEDDEASRILGAAATRSDQEQ
jgi:putative hemolysin